MPGKDIFDWNLLICALFLGVFLVFLQKDLLFFYSNCSFETIFSVRNPKWSIIYLNMVGRKKNH